MPLTPNRFGGNEPEDFLLAAIDGVQARIDGLQALVDALRVTVEQNHPSRPASARAAHAVALLEPGPVAEPEPGPAKRGRGQFDWTPEMRKAAGKRAKKLWKTGKFGPRRGEPGPATDQAPTKAPKGKPYLCVACGKWYRSKDSLQKHRLTVHGLRKRPENPRLKAAIKKSWARRKAAEAAG